MKKIKQISFKYDPIPACMQIDYEDGTNYQFAIYKNYMPRESFAKDSHVLAFFMATMFHELTERVKALEEK